MGEGEQFVQLCHNKNILLYSISIKNKNIRMNSYFSSNKD